MYGCQQQGYVVVLKCQHQEDVTVLSFEHFAQAIFESGIVGVVRN
jgi:hypothetical protein